MGLCFSKKQQAKRRDGQPCSDAKKSGGRKPGRDAAPVAGAKKAPASAAAKKAVARPEEPAADKRTVFVVKAAAAAAAAEVAAAAKGGPAEPAEAKRAAPPEEEGARPVAAVRAPVRTSSCTKEEVDAILIQCGRLSRSSSASGKAPSGEHGGGHRRYAGSKRSYDFDHERRGGGGGGDECDWGREGAAVSRPSPRRRTPERKRSASHDGRTGVGSGSGYMLPKFCIDLMAPHPGKLSPDGDGSSDPDADKKGLDSEINMLGREKSEKKDGERTRRGLDIDLEDQKVQRISADEFAPKKLTLHLDLERSSLGDEKSPSEQRQPQPPQLQQQKPSKSEVKHEKSEIAGFNQKISSGSKRSAEDLHLPVPSKKRTVAGKVSATDPLLSARMQIEAPCRSLQEQGEDHQATIPAIQEQVESFLLKTGQVESLQENKKPSASLKECVQAEATKMVDFNASKEIHEHTQHTQDQRDQALQGTETLRTELEAIRNKRRELDSQLVANEQMIRDLSTSLEMREAQKEEIKVAAIPIHQLILELPENEASKPILDLLRKLSDQIYRL